MNRSNDLGLDGVEQRAFGAPVTAFTLRSLHADDSLGDQSRLSRLIVSVR